MAKDAGAAGVLVPYCENLDDIRACVATGHYHPMKGAYLRRAVAEGVFPSETTKEYLENRNKGSIVIIGIESEPAFNNLDDILEIPGVDAIFVGPNDMTTSLGIPDDWANPKYLDVLKAIIKKSEAKGKPVMIHQSTMDSSTRAIELGARFIMHSNDVRLMVAAMQDHFAKLREIAGASGVEAKDTAETV
jgi:4-hydroxy-2-oxoheptanedioate aldolase